MALPRLELRPKRDKRVRGGHPWIFSNELQPGFADLPPGEAVEVFDSKGAFVGRGLVSPNALIAVRLYSRGRKEDLDDVWFWGGRIQTALQYREARWPGRNALRLINAEGDFLPGLVIDRFGDQLVVQQTTVGTDRRSDLIREALEKVVKPAGAVLRNDGRVRELEGLERHSGVWFGEVPDEVVIEEEGVGGPVKFSVPLQGGQKTGHFYDQAENRLAAAHWCRGRTVLDVYSNTGGWGLHALRGGAESVTFVEKSEPTAERVVTNLELNGWGGEVLAAEATRTLEELVQVGRRFGVVVLDPPAFAKSRKTAGQALRGYERVNALGLTLVQPGGFFFTSSCSYHVQEERFVSTIVKAAQQANVRLRMIRRGEQGSDHPVLPEVPETRYLKSYGFQVLL